MKLDLYKILDVARDATPKQIKKAYRLKALKCHPDKNPDDPKAAEMFHQLSEALKILSDIGARAAYDHVVKAREAAKERTNQLDAKRRKIKQDLEAREQGAEVVEKKQAKTCLKKEIERLRDEGSRILEEEQIKMRKQLKEERLAAEASLKHTNKSACLKLKWKCHKGDETNGGYSTEVLTKIFSKYCNVNALLLSNKRGHAVIELENSPAARLALNAEIGLTSNPLKIAWISGDVTSSAAPSSSDGEAETYPQGDSNTPQFDSLATSSSSAVADDVDDFESAVLTRLKRAQEMKRRNNETQNVT